MLDRVFNNIVYITIALSCMVLAIVQFLFLENYNLFLLSSFIGGFSAIYTYFYILQRKKNFLDVFGLLSFSIGFGYCLSSFRYLLVKDIFSFKDLNSVLGYDLYPSDYSSGMALILVSMSILILCSFLFKGIYLKETVDNYVKQVKGFFFIGCIFLFICLFTGKISFQWSYNENETTGLDPISGFAMMLLPLLMMSSIIFYKYNKKYLITLVVFFGLLALTGRRNILFSLIMIPIFLNYFSINIDLKFFLKKIHYILSILGIFLLLSFYFVALRVVSWSRVEYTLVDNLLAGFYTMIYDNQDVIDAITSSTDDRSFIFNYIALLIHNGNKAQLPLYGHEFIFSFLAAVPSLIFDKQNIPLAMEEYVHPLYGIPVYDAANSILVSGLDDFSFFGMVLYPAFLAGLFLFFVRMIFLKLKGSGRLFIASIIIYTLLQVEQSLTGYFVSLRSIFIFIFIFIFINSILALAKKVELN